MDKDSVDKVLFEAKSSGSGSSVGGSSGSGSGNNNGNNNGYSSESRSSEPVSGGSRLREDLLLIARLRARFPKAMRSLETVVREFKALDSPHSPSSGGHSR